MENQSTDALIEQVASLILESDKTIIFSGAGISTESGIPDFRSPGGIWEKFDPEDFTYQKFVADTRIRKKQWQLLVTGGLTSYAEPNPAHYAAGELHKMGKLDCVITQNVDNLHQRGGVPAEKIFELHGNMQWVVCLNCGQRYPIEQIKPRIDEGEEDPDCSTCRGVLKPDVVLFGESLPKDVFNQAVLHAGNCDLLIVVGSSLVVYPAALIPEHAVKAGAKLAIINLSPTPMDSQADVVIREKAGETMSEVIQKVKCKSKI